MKPGKVRAFSFCTTISLTGNTALEASKEDAIHLNTSSRDSNRQQNEVVTITICIFNHAEAIHTSQA